MIKTCTATLLLMLALAIVGCQDTGLVEEDDAGTSRTDAFVPPEQSYSYEPAGCGYQVSTPPLGEAGASEDVFGATPTMDHVHVSWAGPTHGTFAVNWRSDRETLASRVLYGTDRAAVEAADAAGEAVLEAVGHHMLFRDLARRETRVHEAHVCGLEANTEYFYKVGGTGHWTEVFSTSTAPTPGTTDPFTFAVTGDSRGNEEDAWAISQRRVRDAMADFELFSGDAVILGTAQDQWDEFWSAGDGAEFTVQDLLSSVPLMMANGNHDALAVNFVAQTAFPQDVFMNERAQGEEWYSFDYGNAHFVMLDDNDRELWGTTEAMWLEQDLAAARANPAIDWVFVTHHRPFYTCMSTHQPDTSLRASWQEIFDRHHVDMVFTGHNHVYERSRPIRGLTGGQGVVAAEGTNGAPQVNAGVASGTVYLVAAGVGAPLYEVSTACASTYSARAERTYVTVRVAGSAIEVTVRNVMTDSIVDQFGWSKE
ncbi:purple acid phosphatase family protein [Sandaracinus amylolyticus]|uniref:purple acid phosphatase family protein n=1 Tax=Sandaracinus amylolyticus TaxID=927083 RepID=UPI001F2D9B0E|nr:metallophosphoesterase family protein [Sandaracinus amylolyticus]UJR82439.1 Hypothetical protein I5071_45040 [Sandaracinus amylolyticus]